MNKRTITDLFMLLVGALFLFPAAASGQQQYEREYPDIPYAAGPSADAISTLFASVASGEVHLEHDPVRGYLDAVLEALDIDPASQILIFSKTSLKQRFIEPGNPRAIYFNDTAYVGWVPGSSTLEVAAMDATLGPVFFELPQAVSEAPQPEHELNRCLRCHDSYSLSGGGVPRFMLSTVLAGETGDIVSHEINLITDTAVPVSDRWGGLFVTGLHGQQRHLGNIYVRNAASLQERVNNSNGNRESLDDLVDLSRYLRPTSDIVALLVLEHQLEVQNRMTRAAWEVRQAQASDSYDEAVLSEAAEPLVRSLLMLDEAPLEDKVTGTSGFAEHFQTLGPMDSNGRSLRELDLQTRTFHFPVSYLLYSVAFQALPEEVRSYVYTRIANILTGKTGEPLFRLNADERPLLISLLEETLPGFAKYLE